jgi:hypothetical protein
MPLSKHAHSSEDLGEHDASEYDVKYLGHFETEGILLLYPDSVVFSPKEDYDEKIEIPVAKIKDVRFASENDISALRVWLVGPVLGTAWKKHHNMLTIDVEDEFEIIQHFVFEGDGVEEIVEELYDVRKRSKMGLHMLEKNAEPTLKITTKKEPTGTIKPALGHGNWQCQQCLRVNSRKAKFCTKCGVERK